MTQGEEKAKAKLLKAALLINEAHRILIKENGGDQNVHAAEESVLKCAAGIGLASLRREMVKKEVEG